MYKVWCAIVFEYLTSQDDCCHTRSGSGATFAIPHRLDGHPCKQRERRPPPLGLGVFGGIDETAQHNRRCARRGITLAMGRESADRSLLDSVSSELINETTQHNRRCARRGIKAKFSCERSAVE